MVRNIPSSPRLINMFATASKKPNATMPEMIAIIIAANALTNVPLKYSKAAQPRIIVTTTKLAITMSPVLSGICDPTRTPLPANYCAGFVFFVLYVESTLIISFIDAVPAMTLLSTCSCK